MSLRDLKILKRLHNLAANSNLNRKMAAAICHGNKIIVSSFNDNRTKFGKDIYCCGHSEANCIHKLMSSSFRGKRKPSLVLASLSGKPTK